VARGCGDLGQLRGNELRYLFRRHLATLLALDERHPKGAPDGFPDSLNHALQEKVYPGNLRTSLSSRWDNKTTSKCGCGGRPTKLPKAQIHEDGNRGDRGDFIRSSVECAGSYAGPCQQRFAEAFRSGEGQRRYKGRPRWANKLYKGSSI
jgi:hypothetical protein